MPAEAIHLSALEDSVDRSPPLQAMLSTPSLRAAARLGAVFVDLPYFGRVLRSMAAHAAGNEAALSTWGERLHHQTPIRFLRSLAEGSAQLPLPCVEGKWLAAFSLGFASHAAVDRSLHPLVNRLAADRARERGTSLLKEHQQVEKVHSILFHRERLGRDLLGTRELTGFLEIDARPLFKPGVIASAVASAFEQTYQLAPSARELRGWARGYGHYVRLLSALPADRKSVV